MNAYGTALIVVHVLSAVVGIGATFTFGVLGALQSKVEGPGAIALLEANEAIHNRLVLPFGLILLPLTGALMIFARGWRNDFWSHTWLWVAIIMYITAAGLATGVLAPGVKKLIALAKKGKGGTPEFMKIVGVQQRLGPVTSILAAAIVVLMVWKPGG